MKTKIKVTNTKLGVCTFWSIVKFEDKLMQMRDLYQVTISDKTEITPFCMHKNVKNCLSVK